MNIAFHAHPAPPSSPRNLCALRVSALSFFPSRRSSRTALPLSCEKSQKLTPLFSQSSALLKKEHFANFFGISGFRTLLQNTGGVPASFFSFLPLLTTHNSLFTNSFRIRTSEKYDRNPFGMRTFKTQDLKPFRFCSCEKTPSGVPSASISPKHFLFFPHRVNMQPTATSVYPEEARGATPFLSCVYFTVLWIPGGGGPLLLHRQGSPLQRAGCGIPDGGRLPHKGHHLPCRGTLQRVPSLFSLVGARFIVPSFISRAPSPNLPFAKYGAQRDNARSVEGAAHE